MIRFIRDNAYLIIKMLVNQLGITIFGLMLAMATSSYPALLMWSSIFSVLFYLFLLYNLCWEEGAKMRIKVDGGRAPYKPLNGLRLSLCANIPNIVIALLMTIGYIFGRVGGGFEYEWAGALYAVTGTVGRYLEGMYLGLIQTYSPHNPIGFWLIILPSLFICTLAYYLGMREFRVFGLSKKRQEQLKK